MICACAPLAPAMTTSPNIMAIVFSCLFITLFSFISEGDLSNRSYYYPRANRSATAAPGATQNRGGRVSGRAGRQIGSQIKGEAGRLRRLSIYSSIANDDFLWDKNALEQSSSGETPQAQRRTAPLNKAIRASSVRRRTGTRIATFAIVCINKPLHRVESTDFISEVERQSSRFAKEKEQV